MDFWNRKKVRRLEEEIRIYKREIIDKDDLISRLREQLDEAERKIRGDRVCDGYCHVCNHGVKMTRYYVGGTYEQYICELDCKCKDFTGIAYD